MQANGFRQVQPSYGMSEHLNTSLLAGACNEDRRFQEAGWSETPASMEQLLLSDEFREALLKLAPSGGRLLVEMVVANTFRCRLAERGSPKRVGANKWHDKAR